MTYLIPIWHGAYPATTSPSVLTAGSDNGGTYQVRDSYNAAEWTAMAKVIPCSVELSASSGHVSHFYAYF